MTPTKSSNGIRKRQKSMRVLKNRGLIIHMFSTVDLLYMQLFRNSLNISKILGKRRGMAELGIYVYIKIYICII